MDNKNNNNNNNTSINQQQQQQQQQGPPPPIDKLQPQLTKEEQQSQLADQLIDDYRRTIPTLNCLPLSAFELLFKIGSGTYGLIWCAEFKPTGVRYALKQLTSTGVGAYGYHLTNIREITLLHATKHKNVVTLYDIVCDDGGNTYLVLELALCDLSTYVKTYVNYYQQFLGSGGTHPVFPHIKICLREMLAGLLHLHGHMMIHRDIKSANVLVGLDNHLKISDFGLARTFGHPQRNMTQQVVTLWYRSPELILDVEAYTTAVDIWSLGCIFAEMALGRVLFPGNTVIQQWVNITELLGIPQIQNWPSVSTQHFLMQYSIQQHYIKQAEQQQLQQQQLHHTNDPSTITAKRKANEIGTVNPHTSTTKTNITIMSGNTTTIGNNNNHNINKNDRQQQQQQQLYQTFDLRERQHQNKIQTLKKQLLDGDRIPHELTQDPYAISATCDIELCSQLTQEDLFIREIDKLMNLAKPMQHNTQQLVRKYKTDRKKLSGKIIHERERVRKNDLANYYKQRNESIPQQQSQHPQSSLLVRSNQSLHSQNQDPNGHNNNIDTTHTRLSSAHTHPPPITTKTSLITTNQSLIINTQNDPTNITPMTTHQLTEVRNATMTNNNNNIHPQSSHNLLQQQNQQRDAVFTPSSTFRLSNLASNQPMVFETSHHSNNDNNHNNNNNNNNNSHNNPSNPLLSQSTRPLNPLLSSSLAGHDPLTVTIPPPHQHANLMTPSHHFTPQQSQSLQSQPTATTNHNLFMSTSNNNNNSKNNDNLQRHHTHQHIHLSPSITPSTNNQSRSNSKPSSKRKSSLRDTPTSHQQQYHHNLHYHREDYNDIDTNDYQTNLPTRVHNSKSSNHPKSHKNKTHSTNSIGNPKKKKTPKIPLEELNKINPLSPFNPPQYHDTLHNHDSFYNNQLVYDHHHTGMNDLSTTSRSLNEDEKIEQQQQHQPQINPILLAPPPPEFTSLQQIYGMRGNKPLPKLQQQSKLALLMQTQSTLTPMGIDLLSRMLTMDPSQRITAEEALNHPWFQEAPYPSSFSIDPLISAELIRMKQAKDDMMAKQQQQ